MALLDHEVSFVDDEEVEFLEVEFGLAQALDHSCRRGDNDVHFVFLEVEFG